MPVGRGASASSEYLRRLSVKFDRPADPHDWRRWIGGLGKALIAPGLLMFGFVAYQLWGTGIESARAQDALDSDFGDLLAGTTTTDAHADRRHACPTRHHRHGDPTSTPGPRRRCPPRRRPPIRLVAEGDADRPHRDPVDRPRRHVVAGVESPT